MTYSSAASRSGAKHDFFNTTTKKKVKDPKPDAAPAIQVGEHGRYQIKSGLLAGRFVARAFAKPPTASRGLIAEASGDTEAAAIEALHEAIDAREDRRTEGRRTDEQTGVQVPSKEEFVEALRHVALTRPQRAILTALALADPEGMAEARLARAASFKSEASASRSLAAASQLIADYLSLEKMAKGTSDAPTAKSHIGFRGEPSDGSDAGNWILYPEMRDAVRAAL